MPLSIPTKAVNDPFAATELNAMVAAINANETAVGQAQADATAAGNSATSAASAAETALSAAQTAQATADANEAAFTGHGHTASDISDFSTSVAAVAAVAANTAKVGIPATSGTPGILANSNSSGITMYYIPIVNQWLSSPADDAILTALAGASWVNNQATVAGWDAGRQHIDSSYLYIANADETVTRISLGTGADATSIQGRAVHTTAPTDGQVLAWVNANNRYEPTTLAGGGSTEFAEDVFRIVNNVDATKKARFDVAAIATGTVRTITMPNANVDLGNVRTDAGVVAAINSELGGTDWQTSGGSNEYADNVFRINDDSDATKQIAFQASAISTGTTRTITMPDADVDLGNIVEFNGTGLVAGDLMYFDGTEFRRDPSAVASAQTTLTLGYAGSMYSACVASAYTVKATGLAAKQSALVLITNATEPTFTLAGGTVTKVGWGSNWDDTNQNHVSLVAESATLVYAYLVGAEA